MIAATKVVAIVGTARPDAAKIFYADALGLKFVRDDGFALVFEVAGAELRVSRVPAVVPSTYAVLGLQVQDIAEAVDGLVAKGAKMERFGFFQQDARGVWTAPDGTKVAWFRDPDMNLLSAVQPA